MSKKINLKPLVIGHRGASGYEPENTLRSFRRALELGADGIELDVHCHKSGELIVTHDETLERVAGARLSVRQAALDELRKIDIGKNERLPLLKEVLEEFVQKFKVINIEIKSHGIKKTGIEQTLARLITDFKCAGKVLISSFNPLHLLRFKPIMPAVKIGYLLCPEQIIIVRNRRIIRQLKPNTLNLDKKMVDIKKFKVFFDMELPQWIWTVNEPEEMRFWLNQDRVEAIITNYPDRLRAIVGA